MPQVFGGLMLPLVLEGNRHLELQLQLFREGLIEGIQLLIPHPDFIQEPPRFDLIKNVPVFVHYAAENCGVDFGQVFDEKGLYSDALRSDRAPSWELYNTEAVRAAQVLQRELMLASKTPVGVAHPGYMLAEGDYHKIVTSLHTLFSSPSTVALENVPYRVKRSWFRDHSVSRHWPTMCYGAGGRPEDMKRLLEELGTGWKMLLDFTHACISSNQLLPRNSDDCRRKMIAAYMTLPHSGICHYSGYPVGGLMVDSHDYFDTAMPQWLVQALQEMEIICLEIPFTSYEEVAPQIKQFRRRLDLWCPT